MICWRGIKIDDHNYAQAKLHFKSSSSYSICWCTCAHTHARTLARTHAPARCGGFTEFHGHTSHTPPGRAADLLEGGPGLSSRHIIADGSCKVHTRPQSGDSSSALARSVHLSSIPFFPLHPSGCPPPPPHSSPTLCPSDPLVPPFLSSVLPSFILFSPSSFPFRVLSSSPASFRSLPHFCFFNSFASPPPPPSSPSLSRPPSIAIK